MSYGLLHINQMTDTCNTCLKYRGETIVHGASGCPCPAKNIRCRRCHCRGHFTSECDENYAHWERPTTLEELIAPDVRIRLGIRTHTLLEFSTPRNAKAFHELTDDSNIVTLPEISHSDFYKKMGEFMRMHDIKVTSADTKESKADRLKAIHNWCISNGKRLMHIVDVGEF